MSKVLENMTYIINGEKYDPVLYSELFKSHND